MAVPKLYGPFELNRETVDEIVGEASAGVYALGYTDTTKNIYYIQRVGRSDDNLNRRLKSPEYIGHYAQFQAAYCSSPQAAFYDECELWHEFGASNNPLHPDRPDGANWRCPRCKVFG